MRILTTILLFALFTLSGSAQGKPVTNDSTATAGTNLALTGNEKPEDLLQLAARSYSKGAYPEAVQLYEKVLSGGVISDKVYYNLGNAYFKCDRLAPAILNFERALRLNPRDADARFNLEMCEARIVDKIDPIGMFLITRWYRYVGQSFDSNGWAIVSILLFILFIGCLCAYFLARVRWLRKTGFFAGVLLLGLSTLSMVYSAQASHRITHPDEAILYALSVTVKSSPDKSGTDLFVLHEGTRMKIRSVLGEWSEIELEDGNVGWLSSKDIQVI